MAHSRGARPWQCGAQLASTRRRSQGATSGSRAGHLSTSAIPEKETSHGAPPISAAAATSARWPRCRASCFPSATMGGSSAGAAGAAAAPEPAPGVWRGMPSTAQPASGRHQAACCGGASANHKRGPQRCFRSWLQTGDVQGSEQQQAAAAAAGLPTPTPLAWLLHGAAIGQPSAALLGLAQLQRGQGRGQAPPLEQAPPLRHQHR